MLYCVSQDFTTEVYIICDFLISQQKLSKTSKNVSGVCRKTISTILYHVYIQVGKTWVFSNLTNIVNIQYPVFSNSCCTLGQLLYNKIKAQKCQT